MCTYEQADVHTAGRMELGELIGYSDQATGWKTEES
jgi:hypothetical protein